VSQISYSSLSARSVEWQTLSSGCHIHNGTYFNTIPNHNANPTNPNRNSKGNPNPTNRNTMYRCEYGTLNSMLAQ